MKSFKQIFLSAAAFFFLFAGRIFACPNCKEAFEGGTQQASIGDTYSYTVLFMLGMPILAISIVSYVIYSNFRKQRVKN